MILSAILACLMCRILYGQEILPGSGTTLHLISAEGKKTRVVEEETLVRIILDDGTGLKGWLGFKNDSVILVDSTEVELSGIRMFQYNNRVRLLTGAILTVSGPVLLLTTAFVAAPGSTLMLAAAIVFPAITIAGLAVLVSNNLAHRIGEKWSLSVVCAPAALQLPGELPGSFGTAPD